MTQTFTLRPDSKGRVTLGSLARGVSSYVACVDEDGKIILEPFAEVPAREKWLFENKTALSAVKAGLEQAAHGKTRSRGSFAEHANEEID